MTARSEQAEPSLEAPSRRLGAAQIAATPASANRARHWLVVLAAAMILLSLTWLATDSWITYRHALQSGWQRAERIALVLEEQTERSLDISRLVTDRVIARAREHRLEWFATDDGFEALQSMMVGMVAQVGAIWVLDAEANAVASSIERHTEPGNFADRPYFRAIIDGAAESIGGFTYGRVSQTWFYSYNRAITVSGELVGIAQTSMYASGFADLYQALTPGSVAEVDVYDHNGEVVLRWPWDGQELPPSMATRPQLAAAVDDRAEGRVEVIGQDGEDLLLAFRRLDGQRLVVTAGVARDLALQPFYQRLARSSAVVGVMLPILLGLTWITLRALDRERVGAEQVRQSHERLHRVLDSLFAFVAVLEPGGTLLEANQAPLQAAGISIDDVRGRKFWDCYWWSHDPKVQAELGEAVARAARGEVVRYDAPLRVSEEGRIIIDFQLAPLYESGRLVALIASATDVTERVRGEERQRLLKDELVHRVKNMLAVVLALARFSLGPETGRTRDFVGRLQALAKTHELLTDSRWQSSALAEVIARAVPGYEELRGTRFNARGPSVELEPVLAQNLALGFHELATNAIKYGALSTSQGRVDLVWNVTNGEPGTLEITWHESGGPPVEPPAGKGFGSIFLERMLIPAGEGDVSIRYAREGLQAKIVVRLASGNGAATAPSATA